ncbi:hypothetical protein Ciccas_005617 [Cichlidogyrus casuarinus]|uniref:Uncharacterized protein n=1 Tax=Cichlidogyrus casuarinus TaxID=1844966 RepID=A0ABD2Q8L9_9PLAT
MFKKGLSKADSESEIMEKEFSFDDQSEISTSRSYPPKKSIIDRFVKTKFANKDGSMDKNIEAKLEEALQNLRNFSIRGNESELKRLLTDPNIKENLQETVNCPDEREKLILHEAIANNQLGCVRILIEELKAEINLADKEKRTPLHIACKIKREQMGHEVEQSPLMSTGSPLPGEKDSLLNIIKSELHFNMERSILDTSILAQGGPDNPLLIAVTHGNEDIVKILIHGKVNLRAKDHENMTATELCEIFNITNKTPLHLAILRCHKDMAQFLTKYTRIDLLDDEHNTFLHTAALSNCREICEIIGPKYFPISKSPRNLNGDEPLHMAAKIDAFKSAKYFIKIANADLEARDGDGMTVAMIAAKHNSKNVIELILGKGANFSQVDVYGKTPIYHAVENNSLDVIRKVFNSITYLKRAKEAREWVSIANKEKNTPLHCAARNGNLEICKELLRENVSVYEENSEKELPVDLALHYRRSNVAKLLLAERPKLLDQIDNQGNGILHRVARWGHTELISFLIKKKKLEVDSFNSYEQTPLYFAAANGHVSTVRLLIAFGAEVNMDFEHQMGPIHVACQNGHHEVIEYLLEKGADPARVVYFKYKDIRSGSNALDIAITMGHR